MNHLIFILIIGLAFQGTAQPQIHKEKMKSLDFMVGTWNGEGWRMNQRDGTHEEFTQIEKIKYELNGSVLLVRGKAHSKDNELVHNALGLISFDALEGIYKMYAILENGMKTEANLEIMEPGKLKWWFKTESGTIKYTLAVNDGVLSEKGEFSPDLENWYPFLQFSLTEKL